MGHYICGTAETTLWQSLNNPVIYYRSDRKLDSQIQVSKMKGQNL